MTISRVLLSALCVWCFTLTASPPSGDRTQAAVPAATAALPTLIDLGASQCIPCRKMAPILKELARDYAGVMTVEFIDVWQKENAAKARQYRIKLIPTQIFFGPDGKELWRHEGFLAKADILAKWRELGYDLEKLKNRKPVEK